MSKTRKIVIVGSVCIAMGFAGALLRSRDGEPTYQGRSLSSWLDEMRTWDGDRTAPVYAAFKTMGTNALPFLVEYMVVSEGRWRNQSYYWFERRGWLVLRDWAAGGFQRRIAACQVVELMGSVATNALPSIYSFMRADQDGSTEWVNGLLCVIRADPEVVPTVVREVWEPEYRRSLCWVLGAAAVNPNPSIKFLALQLDSEDPSVQMAALEALGRFGTNAASASETVRSMMKDPDPNVRIKAEATLVAIER